MLLCCARLLAQCPNNTPIAGGAITPPCPGSMTVPCVLGNEYALVNVVLGNTYTFSTCTATFDTQITLYSNVGDTLANNNNACGPSPFYQSSVTWVASFTGQVRVLVDRFSTLANPCALITLNICAPLVIECATISLPVELIDFVGHNEGTSNILKWSTATETNNDYYTVQRSADMLEWTDLGTVPAVGTTQTRLDYDFIDLDFEQGVNYYRLKQTDMDGTSQLLRTVAIDNSKTDDTVTRRINYMGQEAGMEYQGFVIEYHERGKPITKYQQ